MAVLAKPSPRRRRLFWVGVLLGFGLLLGRLLCLQGIFIPIRIAGGSMAETLVGDHFALKCRDCGFPFRCGMEGILLNETIVCPNCGYPGNKVLEEQARRGQRVLIDRFPTFVSSPQRWQVVALRTPGKPNEFSVKRVIGLPGERIAIRGGDFFINDQIASKPFSVETALRLAVHDDQFRPTQTENSPPRWSAESSVSRWRADGGGFSFSSSSKKDGGTQEKTWEWLTYRHWRCFSNPLPRTDDSPVLDNDPYSPNESRELHEVSDFTLSFRAAIFPNTQWAISLDNGRDRFVVQLSTDMKRFVCEQNDNVLAQGESGRIASGGERSFEFSRCDQAVALRIDGKEIFRSTFSPTTPSDQNNRSSRPRCALGIAHGAAHITQLRLFRDIYYLPPFGLGDRWKRAEPLGPDEYFLLGDNPVISVDSRDASFGVVSRVAIVGQVLWEPFLRQSP